MKIAFTMDEIVICGGVIVPFLYVRELRKRGYEASIYAKRPNTKLSYYTNNVLPHKELREFVDTDIIINVWWKIGEEDERYRGKKVQFVQGVDIDGNIGEDYKKKVIDFRKKENWKILGVSKYATNWTNRQDAFIIPNGIDDRFFEDLKLERDIDALIEGNNEPNKNIPFAIEQAKKHGHKKIVWFGRETKPIDGVECISSPSQEEIPRLYQRAKHFYKYSKSEGFSLPLLEAMASGCIIHTHDMGGNDFMLKGCSRETAEEYRLANSVDLFEKFINSI